MIQHCFKTHINLRKLIRDSKQFFIWKYLPQFRRYLTDWQNSVAHNHFQPAILPGAFPWKRMPSGHRAQLWAACPVPHVLSSSLIFLIVNACRCNILLSKRTGKVIMWSACWSHEPTYSTRATWAYHHPFKPHGATIPHRPASHLPQPALPVFFQEKEANARRMALGFHGLGSWYFSSSWCPVVMDGDAGRRNIWPIFVAFSHSKRRWFLLLLLILAHSLHVKHHIPSECWCVFP